MVGENDASQLGIKTETQFITIPKKFEEASNIVDISCGYVMSMLLTGSIETLSCSQTIEEGRVWSLGYSGAPVLMETVKNIKITTVQCGETHTLGIGGNIYCSLVI